MKSVDERAEWSRLRKTQTLLKRVTGLKCLKRTEMRAALDPHAFGKPYWKVF